jgi:hypothetical protein
MMQPALSENATTLIAKLDEVIRTQHELSKRLLDHTSPPPGPYALFHHHGLLLERLDDVKRIIRRLGRARHRSTELAYREAKYMPKTGPRPGRPYSKRLQTIMNEQHELVASMRMDAESLYIFANLALDQWSFVIAYALGLPNPAAYKYAHLVNRLEGARTPTALMPFKINHLADAIWLQYQVRQYRNIFIEHVERPWQRGSTMGTYREDFNFFICVPVGWIPEEEEKRMIKEIQGFVPAGIASLPEKHWQRSPRAVLEAAFRNIDQIARQEDRERVWSVWSQIGGSTVSFDQLGHRFIDFLQGSTSTIRDCVGVHPASINLGAPGERVR